MKIHCPVCRHDNLLNDDDIPRLLFSFQCESCNTLLSVKIQVNALNVVKTGRQRTQPGEKRNQIAAYIYENKDKLKLPVLPVLATKIRKIRNDGNGTINDVVELVRSDQTMATKILELANSALYGGLVEITDLKLAIMRLGLNVTETLITALENKQLYTSDKKSMLTLLEGLWEHALGVAVTAQKIAEQVGHEATEEVFTAGLLHDFGYILCLQALKQNDSFKVDFAELGTDEFFKLCEKEHAKLGAWYLSEAGLPPKLTGIVAHHEEIPTEESDNADLHIVALANLLCKKVGLGLRQDESIRLDLTESAQSLNLSEVQLASLEVHCEDLTQQLMAMLK
ncbi:HDOD domain-containing protein [Acanthopleuribacter pedis]|uniref:HDOD domain-containing protein n=1 Tax=Acanthopleuribacter pedis TaxID=442870 RepID=A0A8J7QE16_9BACT|nr:HDOD domain-containing protein [Acanthopleuribacter pedis]MBO1317915.1 HDOD domain-containing protein [Acanthopleuribacter pedis]